MSLTSANSTTKTELDENKSNNDTPCIFDDISSIDTNIINDGIPLNILVVGQLHDVLQPYIPTFAAKGHKLICIGTNTKSQKDCNQRFIEFVMNENNSDIISNIDVILDWATPINEECVAKFISNSNGNKSTSSKKLKLISVVSAGYNHIAHKYCKSQNIALTNVSSALNETTADLALALMLSNCRQILFTSNLLKESGKNIENNECANGCLKFCCVNGSKKVNIVKDLHHSTVGIIGLGSIGQCIAKRCAFGFNCKVLYYNKSGAKSKAIEDACNASYVSFETLLKESHFVLPVCPLTAETKHMFNDKTFQMMRRDAIFVNISRGGICDTDSLIRALNNGWIASAALDVTDPEPLPSNHPLWKCSKHLTIVPHIGSATKQCRAKMVRMAIQNIFQVIHEQPCSNRVF